MIYNLLNQTIEAQKRGTNNRSSSDYKSTKEGQQQKSSLKLITIMAYKSKTEETKGARRVTGRQIPLTSSLSQDVGAVVPSIEGVPEDMRVGINEWLVSLYDTAITQDDLNAIYEMVRYKGFNRDEVLLQLRKIMPNPKDAMSLVLVCSLQGPQRASKTKLPNGKSPLEMGIPASGGQGKLILTCNKITAATADLAAYYMKRLNVPKRLDIELPGWLQFPSAGSISLPDDLRRQHIEFSKRFSILIGGDFQEQIYMQMQANAYLNPSLHLF